MPEKPRAKTHKSSFGGDVTEEIKSSERPKLHVQRNKQGAENDQAVANFFLDHMQVMTLDTEEKDESKPPKGLFSPQPKSNKLEPQVQRVTISQAKASAQSK